MGGGGVGVGGARGERGWGRSSISTRKPHTDEQKNTGGTEKSVQATGEEQHSSQYRQREAKLLSQKRGAKGNRNFYLKRLEKEGRKADAAHLSVLVSREAGRGRSNPILVGVSPG